MVLQSTPLFVCVCVYRYQYYHGSCLDHLMNATTAVGLIHVVNDGCIAACSWWERERSKLLLTAHTSYCNTAPALRPSHSAALFFFTPCYASTHSIFGPAPLRTRAYLGWPPHGPQKHRGPSAPENLCKRSDGLFLHHLRLTYPRMSQVKGRNQNFHWLRSRSSNFLGPLRSIFRSAHMLCSWSMCEVISGCWIKTYCH